MLVVKYFKVVLFVILCINVMHFISCFYEKFTIYIIIRKVFAVLNY